MRILPIGHRALLVDEIDDPTAWALALRSLDLPGVVDVVPAARTVLVDCADDRSAAGVRERAGEVRPPARTSAPNVPPVEIAVRYDGDDLAAVAEVAGVGIDELITLHTAPTYRVEFCGFSPGFAYLGGTDQRLHLPRKGSPRPSVPAGSVAVAAGYTAIYPRPTPGGWHLLGTTDEVMFDPGRESPARLEPGMTVRLVAT